MRWSEAFFGAVVVTALAIFFCVAIPGCMEKQGEQVNECLKNHPTASPNDCRSAIAQ